MFNQNIIAIPPYYSGTSFEEIVKGLRAAVKKIRINIIFCGSTKPLKNKFAGELLDDKEYINGQTILIKKLMEFNHVKRILFLDYFNPGLDLLRYYHEQQKRECKYGALLHGSSFLKDDLYSFSWIKNFELGWSNIYNTIYVASKITACPFPQQIRTKIKVYPWGMDHFTPIQSKEKIYDVIFPHRLNTDKGITEFIEIVYKMPKLIFAVTIPQKKNLVVKNKYYRKITKFKNINCIFNESPHQHIKTLSKARIILSCANQEIFGYSVMKAVLSGCTPVLPNKLNYPEFFSKSFLYNNTEEAIRLIHKYIINESRDLSYIRKKILGFSFTFLLKDFFKK